MVHPQRTSDEKRPGRGRQRINPKEFATTGPRTPETAANYLLHPGLRQDGGGDQRGVSRMAPIVLERSSFLLLPYPGIGPDMNVRGISPHSAVRLPCCPSVRDQGISSEAYHGHEPSLLGTC